MREDLLVEQDTENLDRTAAVTVSFRTKTWKAMITLIVILGWYCTSISLSVYNKYLFSKTSYNFPFPLLTSSIHSCIHYLLAYLLLQFYSNLKPKRILNRMEYFGSIIPCAFSTGIEIGLSNSSLQVSKAGRPPLKNHTI